MKRQADPPEIGDYGIIGDCRTAALVSRTGSIDWYCLPRFDSPAVFGALLDPEQGGRFRVRPTSRFSAARRYLWDTNVLETTFRTDGGVLRVTDAMTIADPATRGLTPEHEILRRLECLEGTVEVEVVCDPRFDYGRRVDPGRDLGSLGIHFDGGTVGLALRTDIPMARRDPEPGWEGLESLQRGERRHASLTSAYAAPVVLCELGDGADGRLSSAAGWWKGWVDRCAYQGPYRDLVYRSMLALKLLMFPPSGAILAAVTTSLPEVPGGVRNWDYRYCWLRDASMTIDVLLHLGFVAEAESFLGWLLHATRLTRPELQVLYDVHGRTDHPMERLGHLSGYLGSTPVRVGNDAVDQLQLDVYGEVLRAARSFAERGGELDRAEASLLADLGETVCRRWTEPDNGIWEVKGQRRQYTHSKAMCWVALRCLLDLHHGGRVPVKRDRGEIEAILDDIRERTERDGWSEKVGSYVAWYGGEEVDGALLLLGLLGYTEPGDPRMESTRRVIRSRLGDHGLIRRYRYDDRLPGREGAFGICAFWEAELLAGQGRLEEACQRFEHAASFANDLGLFSEEIDADSGRLLGNFPQAFTHIGLASAAAAIARGRGRAPEAEAERPDSTEAEARP
jgi:GH15 family glucan-1,4-alpha-glucosidase